MKDQMTSTGHDDLTKLLVGPCKRQNFKAS